MVALVYAPKPQESKQTDVVFLMLGDFTTHTSRTKIELMGEMRNLRNPRHLPGSCSR